MPSERGVKVLLETVTASYWTVNDGRSSAQTPFLVALCLQGPCAATTKAECRCIGHRHKEVRLRYEMKKNTATENVQRYQHQYLIIKQQQIYKTLLKKQYQNSTKPHIKITSACGGFYTTAAALSIFVFFASRTSTVSPDI